MEEEDRGGWGGGGVGVRRGSGGKGGERYWLGRVSENGPRGMEGLGKGGGGSGANGRRYLCAQSGIP